LRRFCAIEEIEEVEEIEEIEEVKKVSVTQLTASFWQGYISLLDLDYGSTGERL